MTDPTREQLLGHLLGALDDDEFDELDARLERDEEYSRELMRWRRRLAPLESLRPEFEPPAGLVQRTCRFVARNKPDDRDRRGMSPIPIPPIRVHRFGWPDVTVLALLLVVAGALILPAIDRSRLQMRLAACQNGLRRLGLSLLQYNQQQQSPLNTLVRDGRLTKAGMHAIRVLSPRSSIANHQPEEVEPSDASAAFEGPGEDWEQVTKQVASVPSAEMPSSEWGSASSDASGNWSGTWRTGMTNDRRSTPSSAQVLLATAPSADLPDQGLVDSGVHGHNILFEDVHVHLLSQTNPRNSIMAESLLPITYVSR